MSKRTDEFLAATWRAFLAELPEAVRVQMEESPADVANWQKQTDVAKLAETAFKGGVVVGILNSDAELYDLFHDEVSK